MICSKCGNSLTEDSKFCPNCGSAVSANVAGGNSAYAGPMNTAPVNGNGTADNVAVNQGQAYSNVGQAATVICRKCGSAVGGNSQFCPNCGNPVSLYSLKNAKKNRAKKIWLIVIIIILALYGISMEMENNRNAAYNEGREDEQNEHFYLW